MDRVFIVDDSRAMRRVIKQTVVKCDCDESLVAEFENGALALEAILAEPPALLLCDINMPVMTGTELLRELGERGLIGQFPIVIITSVSKTRQLLELSRLGASSVIRKPFTAETLDQSIRPFVHAALGLDQRSAAAPEDEVEVEVGLSFAPRTAADAEDAVVCGEAPVGEPEGDSLGEASGPDSPVGASLWTGPMDHAVSRTLTRTFFVDAVPVSVPFPNRRILVVSELAFSSPPWDRLAVFVDVDSARRMALNILGEVPEDDDLMVCDAVGEFCNILAGAFLEAEAQGVAVETAFDVRQVGVLSPGLYQSPTVRSYETTEGWSLYVDVAPSQAEM